MLLIVPLVGLMVAQFTSLLWLSAKALAIVAAVLVALWVGMLAASAALFDREVVLTRWR